MDVIWDGITKQETLYDEVAQIRHSLADAAKRCDWPSALAIISEHPQFVNSTRLGGNSLYTPLHQVAYSGAPVEIANRLIEMQAFRTIQNARGERPVDVAARKGHVHLKDSLSPEYKRHVPLGVLLKIQSFFHAVIRERADRFVQQHQLRLPELEPLLEIDQPRMWFAIPGMYGGFSYRLETPGVEAKLVSGSWCRVAEGSEQYHEITSEGSRLIKG